jgi:DNA polymerase-3 subunit beta
LNAEETDIHISATDLEIGFQQRLSAQVTNTGSITVSGRKLFEIVKESNSQIISIKEMENNWIMISDNSARFKLATLPADEYPSLVEPKDVVTIKFDGDTLSEMIDKTIYAVTVEEAGFKLSGVYTERIAQEGKTYFRMVATDGHRLSMVDKLLDGVDSLEMGNGVMIPKKATLELNKFASDGAEVFLGFKGNNCVAKKEDSLLVIRLLETKFPDYRVVIPQKASITIPMKRTLLLEAMRKMLILSNERYRGVKISLENDAMELVSTNPDLGEARETLDIKYGGERVELGFNARYFMDTLQAMESEEIELGFIDNTKPCVLRGEADKGFLGLIMPMRL